MLPATAARGSLNLAQCEVTQPPISMKDLPSRNGFQEGPFRFRFFDRFDEEARRFEDELRGGGMLVESIPWPRISFWQGYRHLQSSSARFHVLQMLNVDSGKAYQMAVVERPSHIPFFKDGVVGWW